jgi:hypothetical protein
MCTHFSLSYLLSPSPPPFHWCQLSLLSRTCSFLLFSDPGEEEKRIDEEENMTF